MQCPLCGNFMEGTTGILVCPKDGHEEPVSGKREDSAVAEEAPASEPAAKTAPAPKKRGRKKKAQS